MRFFKDMRTFLKELKYLWKGIRQESARMKKLMKMENELGVIGTFLHIFESEMMELPDDIKVFSLSTFTQMYYDDEFTEVSDKDIQFEAALKQYCIKYGVDFPN
tara:strand:- start:1416 stop:1727 length:312 start_codon:yes stop_codon:yes gene_type:complete